MHPGEEFRGRMDLLNSHRASGKLEYGRDRLEHRAGSRWGRSRLARFDRGRAEQSGVNWHEPRKLKVERKCLKIAWFMSRRAFACPASLRER